MRTNFLLIALASCGLLLSACQKQVDPEISVEPKKCTVKAEGENVTVSVSCNTEWTASVSDYWISVEPSSGKGDANVVIKVAASTEARSGKVTFIADLKTARFEITQEKPDSPDVPGPGPDTPTKLTEIKSDADFASFAANLDKYADDDVVSLEANVNATAIIEGNIAFTFDGKGHTVTYDIVATDISDDAKNVGLFRTVTGTIKNLKTSGTLTASPEAGSGTYHIGGIAGLAYDTAVFDNCENGVKILADTKVTHHMGGIVGYSAAGAKILNCKNTAAVEMIIPERGASNASQLGGIVGHIEAKGDIEDCSNSGQVTYEGNGTPRIAGICGYFNNLEEGLFKNCTNSGTIAYNSNYDNTKWSYVGGITGYYGTPTTGAKVVYENCVNDGSVELNITETKSKCRAAGIAAHGGVSGGDDGTHTWELKNCVNNGTVMSSSTTANNFLGGIMGYCEVSAIVICDGCTNNGKISTAGNGSVGGIHGRNCSVKSQFTNFTIGKNSAVSVGGGDFIGLAIGYAHAEGLSSAITGKVQGGKYMKGSDTVDVDESNYASLLVGHTIGSAGSVTGVTFAK